MSESTDLTEGMERLFQCRHHDPHAILGVHGGAVGPQFRCVRPDAIEVSVSAKGESPISLACVDARGLWQGDLAGRQQGAGLVVRARYAQGPEWVTVDPYNFQPSVSEFDLHLLAEGRHWHAYEKLGAHARVLEGFEGVAYLLWAPGASGVSLVGDFNAWDGRLHPMR